jgi:hypothetical protein
LRRDWASCKFKSTFNDACLKKQAAATKSKAGAGNIFWHWALTIARVNGSADLLTWHRRSCFIIRYD